jgi:carbonic anhydrase/acetyltransferase-like protein (isoleucine patch superfamily)
MRKIIVRRPRFIPPFNEPARDLRVLNKPLWLHQRDLLAPYCEQEREVGGFGEIPAERAEMLVHSDNLFFDEPYLEYFMRQARRRRKPVRAAFPADDPAYLQLGLRALTRGFQRVGDLYYVDLWYFPNGPTEHYEPLIVPSEAREVGYYHVPTYVAREEGDLVYWLPTRSVCSIDTWVHVFFVNIVFGIFTVGNWTELRIINQPLYKFKVLWRSLLEQRQVLSCSELVHIGRNTQIDPSAVIQGPTIIGDNVTIGPGCVVTNSLIGNNVTLSQGCQAMLSVISDGCFFPFRASMFMTAIMENSMVAQNTCLQFSVIGRNSFVGAGNTFTDFNLLPIPLKTMVDGRLIELDMPLLGGCVGHNCRLGSGLVIYPARMIESDVVLFASPTRRVIMKNISYEESDHHATRGAALHPRMYPREDEMVESVW